MEVTGDFEGDLIDAIQPIRYGFLANALYAFMRSGALESLAGHAMPAWQLADLHNLDPDRLSGLLTYLANEGYVVETDGTYALTGKGERVRTFEPWYALLVGGYATTMAGLTGALSREAGYAERDGGEVGRGSCGISQFDAIPLVERLVARAPAPPTRFIDIGCGDGAFLLALLRRFPDAAGIGIDPEPASVDAARELAAGSPAADRVEFQVGSGSGPLPPLTTGSGPDCYVASFVLQEIIEQAGEDELRLMLKNLFTRSPDAYLAVVEVDHRPADPAVMRHGLGQAYYNPYYLLHRVTQQRLEGREFWSELFRSAGLRPHAWGTVDPRIDSTGLEFGCLLVAS